MAADTTAPTLLSATPVRGATGVTADSNIVLTFSEAVRAGSGSIVISDATTGTSRTIAVTDTSQVTFSGNTMTINPATDLTQGSQVGVTFASGVVKDADGNSFAGLPSGTVRFTTTDPFNIGINYSGPSKYYDAILAATKVWERVITAGLPSVKTSSGIIDDLTIDVVVQNLASAGLLGTGAPTYARDSGNGLPYRGLLTLNLKTIDSLYQSGQLTHVVTHEIGHILGIGTLWARHGLVNQTTHQYTGANALAQYRLLTGNPGATSVPVEDTAPSGSGTGTINVHWRESVFDSELMTSINDNATPLSKVTIGSLQDLGYSVDYGAADGFTLNSAPKPVTIPTYTEDVSTIINIGIGTEDTVVRLAGVDRLHIAVVHNGVSSFEVEMDVYVGPVSGLKNMWIGQGIGEVVIGSSTSDFINLLGGNDATNGGDGDDVLDGGAGSNFLTGGAGKDTFFVDGRNPEVTWSTVTDFEPGEWATAWGYVQGTSTLTWKDMQGAAGFQGATAFIDIDGNGTIDTSMTFTGKSVGALVTMAGQVGTDPYLAFCLK